MECLGGSSGVEWLSRSRNTNCGGQSRGKRLLPIPSHIGGTADPQTSNKCVEGPMPWGKQVLEGLSLQRSYLDQPSHALKLFLLLPLPLQPPLPEVGWLLSLHSQFCLSHHFYCYLPTI